MIEDGESIDDVYGGVSETVDIKIAGGTYKCRHADQNSVEWQREVRRLTKAYRAVMRREGALPAEVDRQVTIKAFVAVCLRGWSDVRLKRGSDDIPYSHDAAVDLFTKYPRLFTDIMGEALDLQRFKIADLEDATGN